MVFPDPVLKNHLLTESVSTEGPPVGGTGMGAVPSPARTTIPVSRLIAAPLTAQIAPANIRLARAAMIVLLITSVLLV
jgi:hypothetical protein